jgi:tetratricopeptide (TPR) repeat protein
MKLRNITILLSFIFFFSACKTLKHKNDNEISDRDKVNRTSMLIDAVKEKNIGNYESAITKLNKLINSDPKNDVAHYQLSLVWQLQNKFDQALDFAKNAYNLNPKNQWYKLNLVEIYEKLKQFQLASKLREELVVENPQNIDYMYDLVVDYIYSDRWEDAINTYTKIEKQIGITEEVSLAKHRLWMHIKKPMNAANEIQQLINAFPAENRYPLILGDLYFKNKMLDKAKEQYDKALAMNNFSTYMSLAEYYQTLGKSDSTYVCLSKAFAEPTVSIDLEIPVMLSYYDLSRKNPELKSQIYPLLDSIVKAHPDDPKGWSMMADFFLKDERQNDAKFAFYKVLEFDQSKYVIWEQLLSILASEKNFDTVLIYSNKAIELFPSQPFLFYVKGVAHYMKQQYLDAISAFETGKSLVLEPNSMYLEMFIYLGESYHKTKNDERSDAAFEKVLTLDPKNVYILNNYSYYLALRNAKLDIALEMSKRLVELEPEQYNYLDTYAWVFFKKGDYSNALIWIEKALDKGGKSKADILEHYGDILWKSGKTTQAVEQWQKALLLNNTNDLLKQKVNKKSYIE